MKNIFLLDIDDTVFDFRGSVNFLLKKKGLTEEQCIRFHEINDELWRKLERGETERSRLVVERFERLFSEYGIALSPSEFSEEFMRGMEETLLFFDGAHEFVKALTERGRVYAVTNGAIRIQRKKLSHPCIKGLLSGAFVSEQVGYQKPSPMFAQFVQSHIDGYERERAVWIGDSLTSDKKCAESAGIDFILCAPHGVPKGYVGRAAIHYGNVLKMLQTM